MLTYAGQIDPAWLSWPMAVSIGLIVVALAIWWTPGLARWSRVLVYASFYAVVSVTLGLCVASGFAPGMSIAYLFVLTVLSVGGGISSRTPWAIGSCLLLSTLAGVVALLLTPSAEGVRLLFASVISAHGLLLLASTVVRVRDRAHLIAERKLYHDIVIRTPDGVVIADARTGAVLHANPSFDALSGGVEGRSIAALLARPGDAPLAPEALSGSGVLAHAGGASVPVEMSGASVRFEGRDAVALVVRDATDRYTMEDDLRAARDQAEEARTLAEEARAHAEEMLAMKSAFLANMSHELQTPLAEILGYADVLSEEAPEALDVPIAAVRGGAERLKHTIQSLLELGDLEAGRLPVEHATVDLSALARGVVDAHRERAEAAGLPLLFAAPHPALALADRALLSRVLSHLLDNAIKFTDGGRVAVVVAASGDEVEVAVRDSGIGMREEDIAHALAPFHQLSAGDDRTHEGAGLGLSLARDLVAEMGGALTIESEEGVGTLVRVRLPQSPLFGPPEPESQASLTESVPAAASGEGPLPDGDGVHAGYVVRPLFDAVPPAEV